MTEQPSLTPEAACERLDWLLERGRTGQARELLADARRFCAALVAEGADCIPVVTR